jgi:protein SCO1
MTIFKRFPSILGVIVIIFALEGCSTEPKKLPILGQHDIQKKVVDGEEIIDTIYHQVPDFEFISQDSLPVNQTAFAGKIYVTDFFFTTCPTICPKMKTQMLRIYEQIKNKPNVMLLSHSIDPRHDTPSVLKGFAKNLGVDTKKWVFVTGDKAKIYEIAQKSYMVTAVEDATQPGGVVHSGAFILVDKNRHIRGTYDGTEPEKVDQLIKDIELLIKE